MKIIIGERCCGKTTQLISKAYTENLYILTTTQQRARNIFVTANEIGMPIHYPITFDEFRKDGLRGSIVYKEGILIDDADDILKQIFQGIPIKGISLTDSGDGVEYLRRGEIYKYESLL